MTAPRRPLIAVVPRGRMANQMFQAMLAAEFQSRVPGAQVSGITLPEWGLQLPVGRLRAGSTMIEIRRHRFDLPAIAAELRSGAADAIVLRGLGMRVEHFGAPQRYASLFRSEVQGTRLGEREIALNVRAEDILDGHHPKYFPLPLSWYEHVIDTTGLQPVFIGQIGDDAYSQALRSRFRGARFLPPGSALHDFQTLRQATHVALAISSFSWLATWLSERAATIHLPVAGLFDPGNGQTDLMPRHDARYRFYRVPFPSAQERSGLDLVHWAAHAAPPMPWAPQPEPALTPST